jgi:hypothetical protein
MAVSDRNEQQEELESDVVIRPEMDFPMIHKLESAQEVVDTDDYFVKDVCFENAPGWGLWTTIWVTVKGDKHTFNMLNRHVNMKYTILKGEVWVLCGVAGRVMYANEMVTIPRGVGTIIFNRRSDDALYTMDLPGRLDLRRQLGVSMPNERRRVKPVKDVVISSEQQYAGVSPVEELKSSIQSISRPADPYSPMSPGSA